MSTSLEGVFSYFTTPARLMNYYNIPHALTDKPIHHPIVAPAIAMNYKFDLLVHYYKICCNISATVIQIIFQNIKG